ncbi:hypothetical protein BH11CYA1_BH11CYA1_26160 [soil metagenome]
MIVSAITAYNAHNYLPRREKLYKIKKLNSFKNVALEP